MVRSRWAAATFGVIVSIAAGCQPAAETYRTYSEAEDGAPVVAPTTDLATVPTAAATSSTNEVAATDVAAPVESVAVELAPVSSPIDATEAVASVAVSLPRPPRAPLPQRIAELPVETTATAAVSDNVSLTSLTPAPSDGPRPIELLVPEKDFLRVEPGNALRVSYDDLDLLKILNMEPVPANCVEHFPQWLKALDGQRIRIRGFMYPPLRETGLTGFVLARDNQICCFGRFPKVYDVFPVTLAEGETTDYIPNRPFDVVGVFRIKPDVYRGEIENLYEIEEARVVAR